MRRCDGTNNRQRIGVDRQINYTEKQSSTTNVANIQEIPQ